MAEQYKNFFKEMKDFKEKIYKQKQRGLNDYNLLTTVLSEDDEVRLHSRVLYSLLDPHGNHYQGSLFLELFLKEIGLSNILNLEATIVELEHKNIDLYITDGTKHIIVENKIHAGDQESQIKRYIETIMNPEEQRPEGKRLPADIIVIYLSIDREKPSDFSLGKVNGSSEYFQLSEDSKSLDYKGLDDKLKDCSIKFKSVHYKNEILIWLKSCKYEVQNITNLNEAIRQYKEVVEMISKKYKSKSAQIEDFLAKNIEIASRVYENQNEYISDNKVLVNEISNHFPRTLDDTYNLLANKIVDTIKKELGEDASNKIKNVHSIILNGNKRYASNHYIDLVLENKIRIQLMYRNEFNLMRINVYNSVNANPAIGWKNDFKIKNLYKLLTSEELIDELTRKHVADQGLIDELKKLILEYDKEPKS